MRLVAWRISDSRLIPGVVPRILFVQHHRDGRDKGLAHCGTHMAPRLQSVEYFKALWEKRAPEKEDVIEIVQAATTAGYQSRMQGPPPGRPVFGLYFCGKAVAVAISVRWDGYVQGLNRRDLGEFLGSAEISLDYLRSNHFWPLNEQAIEDKAEQMIKLVTQSEKKLILQLIHWIWPG
jgi:hypothetical protein